MARPSLRSNFAWTFAGNAVHAASQWAILSLIAKLGTSEMLGQYALALAATLPVAMLSHLNLRAVLATDVNEQHPFADYRRVRMVSVAAGLAVITVITAVSGGTSNRAATIFFVGVSLMAENVSDLYYGLMQRHERMDLIARSMIGRAFLSIALIALALWGTGSLAATAVALAMGRILTILFYDRRKAHAPSGERVKTPGMVFRTALPLGVVLMLVSLTTNVPRYAIEQYLGTRALGAYAAVASFVTVGSTIINALGQSATTRLARNFGERDCRAFRKLAVRLAGIALALGVVGVFTAALIGPLTLRIVYRPEYAAYSDLLVMVLAAGTASYVGVMLGYVVTATRTFFAQMPLLISATAASAVASWVLVPRLGLPGAAAAMAIAGGIQIAGQMYILRRSL